MSDILKLRELIGNGYRINGINNDAHDNCVISLVLSGDGSPIEGQVYYLVTTDEAVIRKAHEIFDK